MTNMISNIDVNGMAKLKTTYLFVFFGVLTAMLGATLMFPYASMITGWPFWGIVILEFIVLFAFMWKTHLVTYLVFTTLTGITLIPILAHFVNAGMSGVVLQALVGTTVITGLLTLYASTTTKNYLSMGQILFYILIGVVVVSLVNIFIGSSILSLIISIVTMVLFSFFIIYDTQQVLYTDIDPLNAAMNLYLDILNLFSSLLQILGIFGDKD